MTQISKAFKVELPESAGTVCLTEQGLRALREKIDRELGTALPIAKPHGVLLEEWDTFQRQMAEQRTARQRDQAREEAANRRLRGDTDAETAQNIVAELNNPGSLIPGRVFEPKPEFFRYDPKQEPSALVSEWTKERAGSLNKVTLEHRYSPTIVGKREFLYRVNGVAGFGAKWQPWNKLDLFTFRTWTESKRHVTFTSSPSLQVGLLDPDVLTWFRQVDENSRYELSWRKEAGVKGWSLNFRQGSELMWRAHWHDGDAGPLFVRSLDPEQVWTALVTK